MLRITIVKRIIEVMNNFFTIQQEYLIEVSKAAEWWATNITEIPHKIAVFQHSLEGLIYGRVLNHWYPDDPSRGSGYRAIINDFHTDPILITACENAKISPRKLPSQCVQIISPGLVTIRSMENERDEKVIYRVAKNYKLDNFCWRRKAEYIFLF